MGSSGIFLEGTPCCQGLPAIIGSCSPGDPDLGDKRLVILKKKLKACAPC